MSKEAYSSGLILLHTPLHVISPHPSPPQYTELKSVYVHPGINVILLEEGTKDSKHPV